MVAPFKVRDQDRPGEDLGEWTEDGDIRIPANGSLILDAGASIEFRNSAGIADVTLTRGTGGVVNAGGLAVAGSGYEFGDVLTAGQIAPPRRMINSNSVGLSASGTVVLTYFTADKTESIATLTYASGSTAAGATPTLVRYGLYSVAANGDLTLVGSTPNDTTLLAAANTAYAKAMSAAVGIIRGQRYAGAILVVTGATLPNAQGLQMSGTTWSTDNSRLDPAIAGRITGQTDLPASVALAGINAGWTAIPAIRLS